MEQLNCHRTQKSKQVKENEQCSKAVYDDGNIPPVDDNFEAVPEPLPESTRPRKDGPGGE